MELKNPLKKIVRALLSDAQVDLKPDQKMYDPPCAKTEAFIEPYLTPHKKNKQAHPKPAIEQAVFASALQLIETNKPAVLITGRAGTGKTTFIKFLQTRGEPQVIVAPTGVAALNSGGVTIHSFFQIPPRLLNKSEIKPVRSGNKREIMKNMRRLIIDEVSMVRADLVDAIDYALRINRKIDRPFGGVQLVMVGDFFQLPPIIDKTEQDLLRKSGYKSFYALGALVFDKITIETIELQKIFRQTEPIFIDLLGKIRAGSDVSAALAELNQACLGPHRSGHKPVLLTGRNQTAETYNQDQLAALPGKAFCFEGVTKGEFKINNNNLPAPSLLELKVDARVMFTKNDPERRWVNGTLGTVTKITPQLVWVKPDGDGTAHEVKAQAWENHRYEWNADNHEITSQVMGSYTQIPLRLAWASTIHKAQGLTIDDVRVDLESGAFASGQVYVALSRAKTMAGLSFASPIRESDVFVDPAIDRMLTEIRQP